MAVFKDRATRPLLLDEVHFNPEIARRIPPDLALAYHALPVAEEKGRLTVVMVDPSDTNACEALASALGATPCFVQGDHETIDSLLERAWSNQPECRPRFLICTSATQSTQTRRYGRALADLLNARLDWFELDQETDLLHNLHKKSIEHRYDLVILSIPEQPFLNSLLSRPLNEKLLERLPTSMLFVREPRWPLTKTLLVLQDEERDREAVEWTIHLARSSNAAITVLAIVPHTPAMYRGLSRFETGLSEFLKSESPLGRQLRRIAERLVHGNLEGTLRLRQGSPEWQSQSEIAEVDYDLVITGADPSGWLSCYFLGGLSRHLVQHSGKPVLIAKPKTE